MSYPCLLSSKLNSRLYKVCWDHSRYCQLCHQHLPELWQHLGWHEPSLHTPTHQRIEQIQPHSWIHSSKGNVRGEGDRVSVEEVWRDGWTLLTGAGAAIICNHCANASASASTDGHTVVIAYTEAAVWVFNSQFFCRPPENHPNDAPMRAQWFLNIQLIHSIFKYDIHLTSCPWFHVPNENANCFSTACQTVLDLDGNLWNMRRGMCNMRKSSSEAIGPCDTLQGRVAKNVAAMFVRYMIDNK